MGKTTALDNELDGTLLINKEISLFPVSLTYLKDNESAGTASSSGLVYLACWREAAGKATSTPWPTELLACLEAASVSKPEISRNLLLAIGPSRSIQSLT